MTDLLDSKKFGAFMDELAQTWKDANDEQRVYLLDSLKGWLDGVPASTRTKPLLEFNQPARIVLSEEAPKRKGGRPKGSRNKTVETGPVSDKAALLAEMRRPLTKAEREVALEEIARNKGRDPQLIVNDAVLEVVKPNWNNAPQGDGYKHFIVMADRKNERVSFNPEWWKAALSVHGLRCGDITFKPEGLGFSVGAGMGNETTVKSGNAWRVMIG